jgi:hypothetical protein
MALMQVVLAIAIAVQTFVPAFKPEWGVVLPERGITLRGARIERWCSRPGPALTGYWKPDAGQIQAVEKALAPVLEAALAKKRVADSMRPAVEDYYRRYIGIRIRGERVIYINGFEKRFAEHPKEPEQWKSQVVFACDGGHLFFGAEYDVATATIKRVDFNGPAGPSSD